MICKHCDVGVGYEGAGVARKPEDRVDDETWLREHCWVCGRSRKQIEREQRGRETTAE